MNTIQKQKFNELKPVAERAILEDFDNGSRGQAESRPFRIVRYLSAEKSARVAAQAKEMTEKWKAVLETVPESKASNEMNKTGSESGLWKQESVWVRQRPENYLEEKIGKWQIAVKCLQEVVEGKRKSRVRPMEVPELMIAGETNMHPDLGWRPMDNCRIFWDEKKKRYYIAEFVWVSVDPLPDSEMRRRNWPRARKRTEFEKKVLGKLAELLEAGIDVQGLRNASDCAGKSKWIYVFWGRRRDHSTCWHCVDPVEIA